MKYFKFIYRQNKNLLEKNFVDYNQYCNLLQIMYEYYFKSIKTGKISCLEVIFLEDEKTNEIETSDTKTIYIDYDNKKLSNKSIEDIHGILLNEIQKEIIKFIKEHDWNIDPFINAFDKIVKNKYLFEENYLRPFSNKLYKAQIVFKHDYQDSGLYLVFYEKNKLIRVCL